MFIELFGTNFHIVELPFLVFLVFTSLGILCLKGTSFKVTNSFYIKMISLFLALYLTSIFFSITNAFNYSLVFKAFIKWVEIFAIIWLVFIAIDSLRHYKFVYIVLIIACFSIPMYTLIEILVTERSFLDFRIFSGFDSAFAFALLIPFYKNKKILLLAGFCGLAILLSLSRGAYLAFILVVFYMIFKYPQLRIKILSATVLVLFVMIGIESTRDYLFGRWEVFFSSYYVSNFERTLLISLALQTFIHNPITGVGSLNFGEYISQTGLAKDLLATNLDTIGPHNVFLQIAAEEGLFGLVSFSLLFIFIVKALKNTSHYSPIQNQYLIGLKNFFLVFLIILLFGFISTAFRFYLAIAMGLLLASFKDMS
ncbi:MAG: hypothetical protein GF364_20460 [Candidatus Lokiarchaeota archaeon]|nr:hypothetical protein [Candidatus Lokiarchaeota archaeon]